MSLTQVRVEPVLVWVTLESTEATTQADADRVIVLSENETKLGISITYTTGAAETNNTCTVRVYGYDWVNWNRVWESTTTGGVASFVATDFNVVWAAAATVYTGHFIQNILYKKLKVTALESWVATNKGTVTVSLLLT